MVCIRQDKSMIAFQNDTSTNEPLLNYLWEDSPTKQKQYRAFRIYKVISNPNYEVTVYCKDSSYLQINGTNMEVPGTNVIVYFQKRFQWNVNAKEWTPEKQWVKEEEKENI
tara:strand:- start:622 stop:954 length:333 start_codon:yes stop_codon:yes gene_type:complete